MPRECLALKPAWDMFDLAAADWLLGLADDTAVIAGAVAALALGCDSASLAAIARLREPDQDVILNGIRGACEERGVEFPLSEEAFERSLCGVLHLMVDGRISPERASAKLSHLADKAPGLRHQDLGELGPLAEALDEFKHTAINLELHHDADCEFEIDLEQWRAQLLALGAELLDRAAERQSRTEG